jgi:hypothetical protein
MSDAAGASVVIDWGKLTTIAMLLIATCALAAADKVSSDVIGLLLGSAAGYTFGGGAQSKKGELPGPIVGPGPGAPS